VLGGALGLVLAIAGLNLLIAYTGRFTNRTGEITLDGWVLGFTLVVSIAMALLFAWAPRLTFLSDPVRAMAGGGGRATGSIGRRRAQRALVVSQLAASFMLLIGAGLLTRSLMSLYAVDPGFDLANVLSLQAPDFSAQNRERRMQFSRDVLDRVRAEATVQSAAMASAAPLAGSFPQQQELRIDGASEEALASAPKTVTRVVSTGYFETVGTPLRAGRTFQASDSAMSAPAVILSESMARYYLKQDSPIGRRVSRKQFNGNWSPPAEIIGVVADSRADGIDKTPIHTIYQLDTRRAPWRHCSFGQLARPTLLRRAWWRRSASWIRTVRSTISRRWKKSATRRSRPSGSTPR
jgi:putative ABC transport system permease protein